MLRKWIIGIVATALVTLGLVAPASVASAHGHCPSGQGELAQGTSSASVYQCVVFSQHLPGSCTNLSGSWNDAVQDVEAKFGSGYGIRIWLNANCTGNGFPGTRYAEDYFDIPHLTWTYLGDDTRTCNGGSVCGDWRWQASSYQIVLV